MYGARGQTGWELDRLLDESTLEVERLQTEFLPEWFNVTDDQDPLTKPRIQEIYNEQHIRNS